VIFSKIDFRNNVRFLPVTATGGWWWFFRLSIQEMLN